MTRPKIRRPLRGRLAALACAVAAGALGLGVARATPKAPPLTKHLEYVFPDEEMDVYDIDRGNRFVKKVALPHIGPIHGAVASPATGMLYLSYGGEGGSEGNGSLAAYNLLTGRIA